MIVINFKKYKKGKEALKLARRVEKYLGKSAIVCPYDVGWVLGKAKIKVFSQRLDVGEEITGDGSLLNHSDYRIPASKIARIVGENRKRKIILCVRDLREARMYKKLKPWAIALEDEKLIGSGKSITEYRSDSVREFARLLKGGRVRAFCGAGIHSAEDVRMARRLGCRGVLISSAVAKSRDGEKVLRELSKVRK